MAVRILDVVIDFLDQVPDAAKGSSAKSLLRDAIEPDLHLIQPRGVGWSEVDVEPWSCGKPASNSQMFVRGVTGKVDFRGAAIKTEAFTQGSGARRKVRDRVPGRGAQRATGLARQAGQT